MVAQDAVTFVDDQKLKLSDWTNTYLGLECPALWLLPKECRIMPYELVAGFAATHPLARVETLENAGTLALYSHGAEMADHIVRFCATLDGCEKR